MFVLKCNKFLPVRCQNSFYWPKDRQNRTMYISQQNYVEGILKCSGMEDCKLISTPKENSEKFRKLSDEDESFDTQI